MLSIMPIVNTLTALPISFAGIGVRESLFQVLLHDLCRAPEAVGVLIGALGFAIRLLWGSARRCSVSLVSPPARFKKITDVCDLKPGACD